MRYKRGPKAELGLTVLIPRPRETSGLGQVCIVSEVPVLSERSFCRAAALGRKAPVRVKGSRLKD